MSTGLTICVVNYEGISRLNETICALRAGPDLGDEIIVVDSASSDGSVDFLRRTFPAVRVVRLAENLGPAVARNCGYDATTFGRILFVDNDIVVEPGCIGGLMTALDNHPDATIALPRVRPRAKPDLIEFEGAETHFLGLMILREAGATVTDSPGPPVPVGSMASGCFLLDRTRWGDTLPFDGSFRFNYEDHDFGTRSSVLGHRILAVPGASVFHGGGGTEGYSVRGRQPYPSARVQSLIRGRWVILIKTFQLRTLLVLAPVLALYEIFQLGLVARRGWSREWLAAARSIFANRREIRQRRRAIQATRVVRDVELLRGGPLPFRDEFPSGAVERLAIRILNSLCDVYWRLARHAI